MINFTEKDIATLNALSSALGALSQERQMDEIANRSSISRESATRAVMTSICEFLSFHSPAARGNGSLFSAMTSANSNTSNYDNGINSAA